MHNLVYLIKAFGLTSAEGAGGSSAKRTHLRGCGIARLDGSNTKAYQLVKLGRGSHSLWSVL